MCRSFRIKISICLKYTYIVNLYLYRLLKEEKLVVKIIINHQNNRAYFTSEESYTYDFVELAFAALGDLQQFPSFYIFPPN